MNNDNKTTPKYTLGFSALLALLFIALKLTDKIGWSWLWVLSPLWIPYAIIILAFLGILCAALFTKK